MYGKYRDGFASVGTKTGPVCRKSSVRACRFKSMYPTKINTKLTAIQIIFTTAYVKVFLLQVAVYILPGDFYLCYSPFVGGKLKWYIK